MQAKQANNLQRYLYYQIYNIIKRYNDASKANKKIYKIVHNEV